MAKIQKFGQLLKNDFRIAVGRLVKALEHLFLENLEKFGLLLKNDFRMALGRLVKAVEQFLVKNRNFSKMTLALL